MGDGRSAQCGCSRVKCVLTIICKYFYAVDCDSPVIFCTFASVKIIGNKINHDNEKLF